MVGQENNKRIYLRHMPAAYNFREQIKAKLSDWLWL